MQLCLNGRRSFCRRANNASENWPACVVGRGGTRARLNSHAAKVDARESEPSQIKLQFMTFASCFKESFGGANVKHAAPSCVKTFCSVAVQAGKFPISVER